MSGYGKDNPNWRGGRTMSSHGYMLIRVGDDHHLADVRGYAYEHRLIAEEKLGRKLLSNEIVHHINGIKDDNRSENIEVVSSVADHLVYHRERDDLRLPDESNPLIKCACGCGAEFLKYDNHNRPREYKPGHNLLPSPIRDLVMKALEIEPMGRGGIAQLCNLSLSQVGSCLNNLRKVGKARRIRRGVWALAGDPTPFAERENPRIECACGCGEVLYKFDKHWRPRQFIHNHHRRRNE